jgi:hypothetical protein
MLGGKVVSAYRRQAVTGRVQISPWPLGMMAQGRKTARSLCEGSDMPKAERTRAAATRLRRPGGQRVPAELLEHPTRKQQTEAIEALAGRGLGSEEIAERLGLARSTVNKYRRDPEGERERARRERYRGRCRGCGRPTRGSDGPGRAPEWCPECAPLQRRRWSEDQVLDAVCEDRAHASPPIEPSGEDHDLRIRDLGGKPLRSSDVADARQLVVKQHDVRSLLPRQAPASPPRRPRERRRYRPAPGRP